MPKRGSRFLKGYIKWFVIPVIVGAIGFFVVGPRLSDINAPFLKTLKPKLTPKKVAQTEDDADSKKLDNVPEPKVEVTVTDAPKGSSSRRRRQQDSD